MMGLQVGLTVEAEPDLLVVHLQEVLQQEGPLPAQVIPILSNNEIRVAHS